jgi:hypothetical protein
MFIALYEVAEIKQQTPPLSMYGLLVKLGNAGGMGCLLPVV